MALTVIAHLPTCEDGNCSTIFRDSDTGDAVVRGVGADGVETDVRIPASEWAILVAQLPR